MRGARAAAVLLALLLAHLTACASPTPSKATAYITRDERVVLEPATFPVGELILTVQNDDDASHDVVVIRLDEGTDADELPVVEGTVPVGSRATYDYRGDGYRVVWKLDRMKAFFVGKRVRDVVHDYFSTGRYLVLSNGPGDYAAGEYVPFTVGSS